MPKPITLIFCEKDYQAASQLAGQLRTGANHVHLCMATGKTAQVEDAAEVLVMQDVSARNREAILQIYPKAKFVGDAPPLKETNTTNVVSMPIVPLSCDEPALPPRRKRGRPPKIRVAS